MEQGRQSFCNVNVVGMQALVRVKVRKKGAQSLGSLWDQCCKCFSACVCLVRDSAIVGALFR